MTPLHTEAVDVSVVIPTIGRPESLHRCLESLSRCDPKPREIIVVDQSGNGETADVVSAFAHMGARTVTDTGRGIGRARNRGMREASHELVLMTDDDCTVASSWVGATWSLMREDPDRVVTGRVLPPGDGAHVPSTRESTTRQDYTGGLYCSVLYAANMAVDRSQLLALGGFDEDLETAEDNDFCYRWLRAGRRLSFEPDMVIWHHDWRTQDELTEHYVAYWRGQGAFYAKHLRRGDLQMLRFLTRDMRSGLRGAAAAVLRGRPRWSDWRRGIARGLPVGMARGWRSSRSPAAR